MSAEKAIYHRLSTDTDLTSSGIYPTNPVQISFGSSQFTQGSYAPGTRQDRIIITRNSTTPTDTKSNLGTNNTKSIDTASIKIFIISKTAARCFQIAELVRGRIDRKTGTFNGVVVSGVRYIDESTEFFVDESSDSSGYYLIQQYYDVRFAPTYQ